MNEGGGAIPLLLLLMFKEIYNDYTDGVATTVSFDEDTNRVIETYHGFNDKQLRYNKYLQNETNDWKKYDPNKEFHAVLDLTMVDAMTLLNNHGIDLFGEVDYKELFRVIEQHYPYMKCTSARL